MRLISTPNEFEDTCPWCRSRLAYVSSDLVERDGQYCIYCPNCGGSFPVEPPAEFIEEHLEYLESMRYIRC